MAGRQYVGFGGDDCKAGSYTLYNNRDEKVDDTIHYHHRPRSRVHGAVFKETLLDLCVFPRSVARDCSPIECEPS